jgi:tetrahydromethanopterin S-methyltransferase subunit G
VFYLDLLAALPAAEMNTVNERLDALEQVHEEVHLSDAQIDKIAERAAVKALEKVYADIGKNVLKKLAWLVGVVVVAFAMWLAGKGALHQ